MAAGGHYRKNPSRGPVQALWMQSNLIYGRKGRLAEENDHVVDSARCLSCKSYCENCVEVCPNRANISPGCSGHGEALRSSTWIICVTSAATVRASVRGTAPPILTNSPCLPTRLTWKTAKPGLHGTGRCCRCVQGKASGQDHGLHGWYRKRRCAGRHPEYHPTVINDYSYML